MLRKIKVLAILKLPPPVIGTTVASKILLESKYFENVELIHLDVSDRRDIRSLGSIDFVNVLLALKMYADIIINYLKYRPDVVYYYSAQTRLAFYRDIPIVIISKLLRLKLVSHLHGGNFRTWYNKLSKIEQIVFKYIVQLHDGVIVLGDCLKCLYHDIISEEKIFVVRNGIPEEHAENSTVAEKNTVLFLSNFIKEKGFLELLEAARILNRKYKYAKYYLVGSFINESDRSNLLQIVQHYGLDNVEIYEKIYGTEKDKMFQKSTIFVMPTYYRNEGLPYSIIEAMKHRNAIISTKHGAIPELVDNEINGYLIEKNDQNAIVNSLSKMFEDPLLVERMGEYSYKKYLNGFTERRMVESLEAVFVNVAMNE